MERSARTGRLIKVGLADLIAHPLNANVMSDEYLDRLTRNIQREGDYPPLVVRPHPDRVGKYQLLDGHQRCEALRRLGYREARCYLWPCDDEEALMLMATLNRLEGQDQPVRRAELLAELVGLIPEVDLAALLPESGAEIEAALKLIELDTDALLRELEESAGRYGTAEARLVSFLVPAEDEELVIWTIDGIASQLAGRNRRGRALVLLARHYVQHVELPVKSVGEVRK